jgi:fructose-1,6-bisphosphatase/inositol monophosphatase family enzyme
MAIYDLALLTEELIDDGSRFEKDYFWCIDPLDGTLPFTQGKSGYAVSIALVRRDGCPMIGVVYDPVQKRLYRAVSGQGLTSNGQPWSAPKGKESSSQTLRFCMDATCETDPGREELTARMQALAARMGYADVSIEIQGGAVCNACDVLEHSSAVYLKEPKPQLGGGSFWDFAATASVIGTTIAVAATADGGFKMLVLEGTAQVSYPDGTIRLLEAGQMTFVLPSKNVSVQDDSNEGQAESKSAGRPGPVLNFDLERLTQEAGLLNGFAEPISSTSKIDAAASRQATLIADGSLNATDARIVEVLGDSTVVLDVSNTLGIRVSNAQGQSNLSPALKRLSQVIATITPQVDPLDELNIFEAPGVALPSYVLPELSADDIVLGLIAGNINLIGGDWDLSTNPIWQVDVVGGREAFFLRAADTLNINNETLAIGINEVFSLSGFTQDSKVEMLGRQALFIESGSEILIDELIHSVNLSLDSYFSDINLDTVTINNQSGSLRIFSEEGDLTVSDSMLFAGIVGAPIFPITLVEDGLERVKYNL